MIEPWMVLVFSGFVIAFMAFIGLFWFVFGYFKKAEKDSLDRLEKDNHS